LCIMSHSLLLYCLKKIIVVNRRHFKTTCVLNNLSELLISS